MSDDFNNQLDDEQLDKISAGMGGPGTHPLPRDPIRRGIPTHPGLPEGKAEPG